MASQKYKAPGSYSRRLSRYQLKDEMGGADMFFACLRLPMSQFAKPGLNKPNGN